MPVLGVQRVRSRTIRGAVEMSLQFDPDSDMVVALQLVQAQARRRCAPSCRRRRRWWPSG